MVLKGETVSSGKPDNNHQVELLDGSQNSQKRAVKIVLYCKEYILNSR